MSRKDTIWTAIHKEAEIERLRIQKEAKQKTNLDITKLEASALLARRSQNVFMSNQDIKEYIKRIRSGINE